MGRVRAASTIKLKIQTAWDAGTLGYVKFQELCKNVGEMSDGKMVVEGFPAGAIVGIRVLDHVVVAEKGYHSFSEAGDLPSPPEGSRLPA